MLSQELGKNSTDTADGCAGLEKDLQGFIISVQKSISKGLFSEALIRGRLLSIGWWSLGSGMIPRVWESKEEITKTEPQWRPWQIVQHAVSDPLERLRTWNKQWLRKGLQEETPTHPQLVAVRAVIETEPRSPGLHISSAPSDTAKLFLYLTPWLWMAAALQH